MIRYRALPPECFAALEVAELEAGATNEDLARAYRDVAAAAATQRVALRSCSDLSAGAP